MFTRILFFEERFFQSFLPRIETKEVTLFRIGSLKFSFLRELKILLFNSRPLNIESLSKQIESPFLLHMIKAQPTQQFVGDYLIIDQLGIGTSGKVQLAEHKDTKQKVAIKVINKNKFLQKQDLEAKIRREIALMRLFDHPHILKLVEVCESQRRLYIVLEYAQNGELFDYLVRRRALSVEQALSFFRQLIYGLDFLHRHAICHRDLKPENILLDEYDRLKIADFGFARWMRGNVADTSCGSPHYAAPEVIKGLVYDGRAADVWSCGVILYALLAGHLPFDDPSIRNLMAKVKMGRYQMPAFTPEIQNLISRMLCVDATKRITIDQIKEHPGFRIGLPRNYAIPKPLPLPSLPDPMVVDDIDPKVFTVLTHLGYVNEKDIKAELESSKTNMAKVFVHMLTSTMSLDWLPWNGEVGEEVSEDNFLVEEQPIVFVAHAGNSDPFHRRKITQQLSLGSPDLFSFVEKSTWGGDVPPPEQPLSNKTTVGKITSTLTGIVAALQQLLSSHSHKFFHPNDETIITRIDESEMYVIVKVIQISKEQYSLQLQQVNGSPVEFSSFLTLMEEFAETFA